MHNRIIHGIAGSFIIISLILAMYVNINWLWLAAFVGVNLFQSSLTQWCLLQNILNKLGVKNTGSGSCGV
ncbi:DUF2892 domain-containing protein [Cryomorpha ignava]|uniref:DUF2892 domain-containing protein n=1 Tax=Cryomorpha ignava TaxID=101383 RepID=A0A7K3WP43_9FLAO|nr:DUF2892 domain-containing protein [Cryomorpha ignava]NEN23274.1 DUF2892 domain-containing protein [Cryomorpha ignava]